MEVVLFYFQRKCVISSNCEISTKTISTLRLSFSSLDIRVNSCRFVAQKIRLYCSSKLRRNALYSSRRDVRCKSRFINKPRYSYVGHQRLCSEMSPKPRNVKSETRRINTIRIKNERVGFPRWERLQLFAANKVKIKRSHRIKRTTLKYWSGRKSWSKSILLKSFICYAADIIYGLWEFNAFLGWIFKEVGISN